MARRWMTSRGWDSLTQPGPEATRWRPGYAPRAWTTLTDHLRALGHTNADLVDSGLGLVTRRGTTVDRFRNRLVLPLVDQHGVIGFVGRALPGSGDQAPIWLNLPRTALYDKGRHLFGLTQSTDRWKAGPTPVLVEGPGDAIAVSLAGRAAVAPCGTAFTAEHVEALDGAVGPTRGLVIAMDGDPPGRAAVDRAAIHPIGRRRPGRGSTRRRVPRIRRVRDARGAVRRGGARPGRGSAGAQRRARSFPRSRLPPGVVARKLARGAPLGGRFDSPVVEAGLTVKSHPGSKETP